MGSLGWLVLLIGVFFVLGVIAVVIVETMDRRARRRAAALGQVFARKRAEDSLRNRRFA